MPGQWDQYTRRRRALVDGRCRLARDHRVRSGRFHPRADREMDAGFRQYLLRRILALCPFVDDPAAGIAKMRDVLGKRRSGIRTARARHRSRREPLGCRRRSPVRACVRCADVRAMRGQFHQRLRCTRYTRQRTAPGFCRSGHSRHRDVREDVLVAAHELAQRRPEAAARLGNCANATCRNSIGTSSRSHGLARNPEALAANLNLIDDAKPSPVPQGIWDQLSGQSWPPKEPFLVPEGRSVPDVNDHPYGAKARSG